MRQITSRRGRRFVKRAGLCSLFSLASLLGSPAPLRAQDWQEAVLDQLKTQFNRDQGVLRLVVLVSPTCPECVGGAEWVYGYVLKRYPNLPIRVYAVWYEMYPGDSPDDFPEAKRLMPDRRVTHWWDPSKDVGRWFTSVVPTNLKGDIQWDAYYLYGEQAVWGEQPPRAALDLGPHHPPGPEKTIG